jgi:hypothetical protein
MDGNFMTFQVLNKTGGILTPHILVTGCWHPCQHDDFPAMLHILTAQNVKTCCFIKFFSGDTSGADPIFRLFLAALSLL